MLERSHIYDDALVARLGGVPLTGVPTNFPQRGVHTSQRRGASLEFSEHTEYVPGDDLRNLDWKVYGKSDRYFVRRFEDERLQRALILVDASGSMSYGGSPDSLEGSKYHLAARVAVALSSALLRQGDAVGLAIFGEGESLLTPRGGAAQLEAIIELLLGARPGGNARFSERLPSLRERIGAPATLYVLSDFLDEEVEGLRELSLLRARRLYPKLIQLLHHDEINLPFEGTTRFRDLESSAELAVDPEAIRRAYFEEIKEFVEGVAATAYSSGLPYAFIRDSVEAGEELPLLLWSREGR